MTRKELRRICKLIAEELAQKPYADWRDVIFPKTYTENRNGVNLNVELTLLEDKPDFLQIEVDITDGKWLRDYLPVGRCFIVQKPH